MLTYLGWQNVYILGFVCFLFVLFLNKDVSHVVYIAQNVTAPIVQLVTQFLPQPIVRCGFGNNTSPWCYCSYHGCNVTLWPCSYSIGIQPICSYFCFSFPVPFVIYTSVYFFFFDLQQIKLTVLCRFDHHFYRGSSHLWGHFLFSSHTALLFWLVKCHLQL